MTRLFVSVSDSSLAQKSGPTAVTGQVEVTTVGDVTDSNSTLMAAAQAEAFLRQESQRKKWSRWIPPGIFLVGIMASAAFSMVGIRSVRHAAQRDFYHKAAELVEWTTDVWETYENALLWAHQAIHTATSVSGVAPLAQRRAFSDVYEHLITTGLEFDGMWFLPRVTHDERSDFEEESAAYISERFSPEEFSYTTGFLGLENVWDEERNRTRHKVLPRQEADYYYPQHFVEPMADNLARVDFDALTSLPRRGAIESSLASGLPELSIRSGHGQYKVYMVHPGTKETQQDPAQRQFFTQMAIEMSAFLRRTVRHQYWQMQLYVFDSTESDDAVQQTLSESWPVFLGGIHVHPLPHPNATVEERLLDEISLVDLLRQGNLTHTDTIEIASSQWTIVIVSMEPTWQTEYTYVMVGGTTILLSCLILAFWVFTDAKRSRKLTLLKREAEQEHAALLVENANQLAKSEKELNDYVAHEVRNPLSAAISACSFVRTELSAPNALAAPGARKSVVEDLDIVDNSLQFINTLLRNMLDSSRAYINKLKAVKVPTDLLEDVLRPIDSMLYTRGRPVDILLECPRNLIVSTDPMRLKQIILNLARNSSKFVEKGFVKLRAEVPEETGHVTIFIEDSGPGIPVEKRQTLFAKFQASLDSLNQGTGIGLSLCKKLSELMDINLWLDESYHSGVEGCPGARFVIDLQTPPEEEDDPEAPRSLTALSHTSADSPTNASTNDADTQLPADLNVLFVDDDRILRRLFSRAVSKIAPSWRMNEAASGETALKMVDTESFDLIFVDQYMASVERTLLGTETVRAMRAKGVEAILCGLSANEMAAGFLENGANGFILKPFPTDAATLKTTLQKILASSQNCPDNSTTNQSTIFGEPSTISI